ncbi:MAG: 50S ribosomal protein L18 [Candidatus Woesearchaeota archaeon]
MSRQHRNYRRKEKTDYNKRLNLLKSGLPRLVVRVSLKNITVQIVEYSPEGDKILSAVSTKHIADLGWKGSLTNLSAAYLLGMLIAKKTKVKKAVLDIGLKRSVTHSKIYSLVKGANDAGLEVPVDESMYPEEERIKGEHVVNYVKSLSKENYEKIFSGYKKRNFKPEEMSTHFNEIKSKIEGVN